MRTSQARRAPGQAQLSGAGLSLADPVVLIRSPYRVMFAYAGSDDAWQPTWRDQMQLPTAVRVSVRDAGTGQVLAVSSAAIVHVNAPAECARAKNINGCLAARSKGDADKKEEQL